MNAVRLDIERAGPLTTIQDRGRTGLLAAGISASGPMDGAAFARAGCRAGSTGGAGIEFTRAGLDLHIRDGAVNIGWEGGAFAVAINGVPASWPGGARLGAGDRLAIAPGPAGNYGYLRFGRNLALPPVLGSLATNTRAGLGGLEGRGLRKGDSLVFEGDEGPIRPPTEAEAGDGPIRFVWGIHADLFEPALRARFVGAPFAVTPILDRMGVQLADPSGIFAGSAFLSLVSEPVLPGDIQILGNGTPIVLMRDHQPTGGYPRIGTVISADLDRFAQIRPGGTIVFAPVSVDHAHRLLRSDQT